MLERDFMNTIVEPHIESRVVKSDAIKGVRIKRSRRRWQRSGLRNFQIGIWSSSGTAGRFPIGWLEKSGITTGCSKRRRSLGSLSS